jgi:CheY-like chemotaxis protein
MNTILCIDDDPITLMFCSTIIKKNSFALNVVSAMNGQQAINYYADLVKKTEEEKKHYPELVFLDLNMPVMNGWEFLDEFVKTYYTYFPKTKVVILTSSIDPKDEERATNYSIAIDFLSKPLTNRMLVDLKELIHSIESQDT